jgi:predicted Fe-Mo cluster-binding NifX family protein
MRIIITAQGKELTAPMDPRFGRCAFFILWDSETKQHTAYANEAAANSGAGIGSAQFVIDKHAEMVITGQIGPRAAQVLQSAGIEVQITTALTVQEAIGPFQKEETARG